MKPKPDICLMDITSQTSLELSEQDLNDIHSAIGFSITNCDEDGAEDFNANLNRLDKKLWKFIRKMNK